MSPACNFAGSGGTADAVFKSACKERVVVAYTDYNPDISKVSPM